MTPSESRAVRNSNAQYLLGMLKDYGFIFDFAGTEAPEGFAFCDGRSLSKSEYPDLFDVIGYTYGGSGDNYNLPDLRERVTVGYSENSDTFNQLGKKVGEKTHQLTVAEMPTHRHNQIFSNIATLIAPIFGRSPMSNQWDSSSESQASDALKETGGDQPHNNIQPSFVCHKIIRIENVPEAGADFPDEVIRDLYEQVRLALSNAYIAADASDAAVVIARRAEEKADTANTTAGDALELAQDADEIARGAQGGVDLLREQSNNTFANAVKGTLFGATVSADDVSPVEHELSVKLSSKNLATITGMSDVSWAVGYYSLATALNTLPAGIYTLSMDFELTERSNPGNDLYGVYIDGILSGGTIFDAWESAEEGEVRRYARTFTIPPDKVGNISGVYAYGCGIGGVGPTGKADVSDVQIEKGSTATAYTPKISDFSSVTVTVTDGNDTQTKTANAEGTVSGLSSYAPSMSLYSNNSGVFIECGYNKDVRRDDSLETTNKTIVGAINELNARINLENLTWIDIRNMIRLGHGAQLFPVGYEFTTLDSDTGINIVGAVRGHDHHAAANSRLKHTMTLEVKYVYSNSSGSYKSLQFDAPEAMYYAAEELEAGTYNFTWNYATGSMVNGTYQFTLAQAVPAGGQIVLGTNSSSTAITSCKVSTYASVGATSAIESNIAVTAGSGGTSLGTMSATASTAANLNCCQRVMWGSNNYAQSAMRQWLNSSAAAGSVWTPTNKFDRAPSWNSNSNGFMHGLPSDFLAVVQPAIIPCRTNSLFEVASLDGTEFTANQVYELEDMFFILSRPEIFGDWDSPSYKDGTQLEYYEGLTQTERIKRDAAGSARGCWLRSPVPVYAGNERYVTTGGSLGHNSAYNAYGVAPACIIA